MRRKWSLFFLIICPFQALIAQDLIRPYITDGCTVLPIKNPEVYRCCQLHDLAYWASGTKEHRIEVDLDLKLCVEKADKAFLAQIMSAGVFLGSLSPWKFKGKQWGNAWGEDVRDRPLSLEEIKLIEESLLSSAELPKEEVFRFIFQLKHRNLRTNQ